MADFIETSNTWTAVRELATPIASIAAFDAIIADIRKFPSMFWEFLTDYYNPYMHPIVIDTGMDAVLQQMRVMG